MQINLTQMNSLQVNEVNLWEIQDFSLKDLYDGLHSTQSHSVSLRLMDSRIFSFRQNNNANPTCSSA